MQFLSNVFAIFLLQPRIIGDFYPNKKGKLFNNLC